MRANEGWPTRQGHRAREVPEHSQNGPTGAPKGRDCAGRLCEETPGRGNRNVAVPRHSAGIRGRRPRDTRGRGHEARGPLIDHDHLLGASRRRSWAMRAARIPRLGDRAADRARLARVERFPCRGGQGLRARIAGEHPAPSENLGDVQHRPAGAEPCGDEGDCGQAPWHRGKGSKPEGSLASLSRRTAFRFPRWTTLHGAAIVRPARSPGQPQPPARCRATGPLSPMPWMSAP